MIEVCDLLNHGVDWTVAWGGEPPTSLSRVERTAMRIAFAELGGSKWDRAKKEWVKPDA